MDIDSIFQQFNTSKENMTPSTERVAVRVLSYIVPDNQPENAENTRIIGKRIDTGEKIEIGLRDIKGDRPAVSRLLSDDSSMPVQTAVGGTIMVDGAYLDNKLSPLSGENLPVYNARWFHSVAKDRDEGWAVKVTARINPVTQRDKNNPAQGLKQSITILNNERASAVTSLNDVDLAVMNLVSCEMYAKEKNWYKRPGMPSATVRIRSGDKGAIFTINSRLVEENGNLRHPNISETANHIENNAQWQARRQALLKIFQENPSNTTVEVIPSSQLTVGQKTLQSDSKIGALLTDNNGNAEPQFSEYVIGVRRSKKHGNPIATLAMPVDAYNPILSNIGVMDKTQVQPQAHVQTQAQSQPQAHVQTQAQPQPQAQNPVHAIRLSRLADTSLLVEANTPQAFKHLENYANQSGGLINPSKRTLEVDASHGAQLNQYAQRANLAVTVIKSEPTIAQTPAPAPNDLSNLDLNNVDFNQALNSAYNPSQQR